MFREAYAGSDSLFGHFPLLNKQMDDPNPSFYALKQMTTALTDKRFNGRVMTGDTATDALVRMYEFEDTATLRRTWVGWKNGGAGSGGLSVKLPVRSDTLASESLAYTDSTPEFPAAIANDGWLTVDLDQRPVFIREMTDTLRPDLRVDSVTYVAQPGPVEVKAWVTNHGQRTTPSRSIAPSPYPTYAVLKANDDSIAQQVRTTSIAKDLQVVFTFTLSPGLLPDTALLSVIVNPSQTYVELGIDDNTGHALVAKP
jgi:hypothetical protein